MSAHAAKPSSNGDVYVYERRTKYDPKTRRTKTVSTKLLGKIPAGETEMIPTRPKKKPTEETQVRQQQPASTQRTHTGLENILEWIGRESGIDSDLMTRFGEGSRSS